MALSPECPRTPSLTNVISMAVKRWGRAVVEGGHGSLAAGWVCWMTLLGDLNTVPQRNASSESVQLLLVLHPSEDYVFLVEPCWKLTCFVPSLLHACQDPLLALWMSPVFHSCIVTHLEDVGMFQTRQVTWWCLPWGTEAASQPCKEQRAAGDWMLQLLIFVAFSSFIYPLVN